jgi:hypothetical protein
VAISWMRPLLEATGNNRSPIAHTFDLVSQDSNFSQNQDQSQFDQIPPATSLDMSISTNDPRSLPDLTEMQNVSQQSQLFNMSYRSENNGLLYSNRNPSRRTRSPRSSRSCSPSDSHPSQRARLTYAASFSNRPFPTPEDRRPTPPASRTPPHSSPHILMT